MTVDQYTRIPRELSIKTNSITVYTNIKDLPGRSKYNDRSRENLKVNKSGQILSKVTRGKITAYINIMLAASKWKQFWSEVDECYYRFKVNLITLDLPSKQMHTDNEIKNQCLQQFLNELRRRNQNVMYFWRAEKQVNGNIHFHIASNQYYYWKDLREDWNRILEKLGYISAYSNDMMSLSFDEYYKRINTQGKYSRRKAESTWLKQRLIGFSSPNSTDVHATKNIRDLGSYLAKYCAKDDEKGLVQGKKYGASQNIVKYHKFVVSEIEYDFQELQRITDDHRLKVIDKDYCRLICGNIDRALKSGKYNLSKYYMDNLKKVSGVYPV